MLFQCLDMLNEYLNYKEKHLKNTPMWKKTFCKYDW